MNATEFCEIVEQRLGWEVPTYRVRWKALSITASRVMKKIDTNPALYTWDNLLLAVELLAREKTARTPLGVFAHVERAVELAVEPEADIEGQIREVMRHESMLGDPQGWCVRFARTDGHFRKVLLDEWKQSVR